MNYTATSLRDMFTVYLLTWALVHWPLAPAKVTKVHTIVNKS